jgi:hypothetical protein
MLDPSWQANTCSIFSKNAPLALVAITLPFGRDTHSLDHGKVKRDVMFSLPPR